MSDFLLITQWISLITQSGFLCSAVFVDIFHTHNHPNTIYPLVDQVSQLKRVKTRFHFFCFRAPLYALTSIANVQNILADVHMCVEGHECHIQLMEKQVIFHSFEGLDLGCHVGEDTCVINISVETIYKALQEFKAVQKRRNFSSLDKPQTNMLFCLQYQI